LTTWKSPAVSASRPFDAKMSFMFQTRSVLGESTLSTVAEAPVTNMGLPMSATIAC
jgi:hypothetical protein